MKKRFISSMLAILASCSMTFAQWGGGGFDFGGGGSASSGSLGSYTSKTDIDYVGDNHVGHKLDIYYPNDGKATHNVIIHIYGSAWGSNSSKGSADHGTVGKAALEAGYIFVTPNHRTYNDALWPAQINDIKAVVRYLRGNKADLKIDDSFIGISGFSSGGHLASMMGVTNGETVVKVGSESIDIEGKLGKFTSECSAVDAVCDWSGPVDCRDKSCGNPINMSPENDMVGGCTPQSCPDKHATLGTNTYIDANDVPHMICHGTSDNIVPSCEGEKYKNNLEKAGIYVEWYNPGHGHQVNGDYTGKMITFFNKIRDQKIDHCGGSSQGGGQQGGDQGGQTGEQGGQQGGGSTVEPKTSTPYKGVAAKVPGTIEAENYDEGGSNVAWYDKSDGNSCDKFTNEYRSDDIDIKKDGDAYIVGNCQSGEWMKYTVDVEYDGEYELTVRVGEGGNSGKFSLTMDDNTIDYTVNVDKTGDWGTYAEQLQSKKFNLKKGTHVLTLTINSDWVDIDWLKFTSEKSDVETIVKRDITIVPNPASTAIHVYSEGEIEDVSIFNAIGDAVARSNESRVDVSSLPTGIYFVKATVDGESVVKRLVVAK